LAVFETINEVYFMLKFISKLFGGSKSEKDVQKIMPVVQQTLASFSGLSTLSNDELRHKTIEFRERIHGHLSSIDQNIQEQKLAAEQLPVEEIHGRDEIYKNIDKLKKERDKKIEEILAIIQPEAFAVVKEAARRFTHNETLRSTATELDRELSVKKPYITIQGNESIYANSWTAGGGKITWNMVHYDVQLIGGSVLHQGKIAEMATGEGKTLVSTLPAYLNALAGEGVLCLSGLDCGLIVLTSMNPTVRLVAMHIWQT